MEKEIQIFREGLKRGAELFKHEGECENCLVDFYRMVDTGSYDFMFADRDFATDAQHIEHCTPDEPCPTCKELKDWK